MSWEFCVTMGQLLGAALGMCGGLDCRTVDEDFGQEVVQIFSPIPLAAFPLC